MMKPKDFLVTRRPKLSAIAKHPDIDSEDYERHLQSMQRKMQSIQQAYLGTQERAVVVLEGWDTAGKGGVVRRLGWALDPRSFKVYPIAAPLPHEKGHHHLQRFWEKLPEPGQIVVFDRSWYGRVLVERVERFTAEADWLRGYGEINDFERSMARHQMVVLKFWLAISKEEQFRRFKRREKIAFKRFKITADDWRNRKKWDAYEEAVCHMIDRTSTSVAPWTLVEANNKYFARLKVLRTVCDALEAALDRAKKN
jgi:polyphosphate kinase 2 (PPK2 family)